MLSVRFGRVLAKNKKGVWNQTQFTCNEHYLANFNVFDGMESLDDTMVSLFEKVRYNPTRRTKVGCEDQQQQKQASVPPPPL